MLEGLEITEVTYSKLLDSNIMRMESEFYISDQTVFLNSENAGDIVPFVQYGTSKELNEINEGYPVLRLNEFESAFISKPAKYCNLLDEDDYISLKLRKDDVLICRTNGNPKLVGKSALVPRDYEYAFASYLFRVRPNRNYIYPAALVSYLNSRYGRTEIEKYSMVGNQANFSPAKFREIKIPIFGQLFNIEIERLTYRAFEELEKANSLYNNAESILLEYLGISEFAPNRNSISKKLSSSLLLSGRLDAEYYLPQFDELLNLLEQFDTQMLGELVAILKSVEPGSDYYLKEGIPFVRVSDLTQFGVTKPSIYLDKEIFKDVIRPKKDTILLSKDGSIGIAYKVDKDEDFITSGAILHLQIIDNNILPDYLALVINSKVVQMQAERDSGGSIIQHWKPSEISNVVIPILPMEKQLEISQLVQESFILRNESKRLQNVAKTAVEIAIGESENTALNYLKENGNG